MPGFDSSFDSSFEGSSELPEFDYVAHAIARLPHMYRSSDPSKPTNTEKSLRARLAPANDLGAAMRAVLTQQNIDTAIGAQLDVIGALVGRPRNGVTDDEIYRRYCRAQIATNKSNGVINDRIKVARAVIGTGGTVRVSPVGAAATIMRIDGIAVSDDVAAVLVDLVLQATSDGVLAVVVWPMDPSTVGRWGSGIWGASTWGRSRDKEF